MHQILVTPNIIANGTSYYIHKYVATHLPSAKATRPGSVSAALIKVSRPIIPNWSCTILAGMETIK